MKIYGKRNGCDLAERAFIYFFQWAIMVSAAGEKRWFVCMHMDVGWVKY